MVQVRGIPVFVSLAVMVLFGIVLWGIRRTRASRALGVTADDWSGNMLVWLLMLAAFVTGAFISYVLLRP